MVDSRLIFALLLTNYATSAAAMDETELGKLINCIIGAIFRLPGVPGDVFTRPLSGLWRQEQGHSGPYNPSCQDQQRCGCGFLFLIFHDALLVLCGIYDVLLYRNPEKTKPINLKIAVDTGCGCSNPFIFM